VWTVKVRPGGKWSDGSLNTSEDYRYQWETYNDDTIVGGPPDWIRASGDPPLQVVVIDEDTVEFRYSGPNWLFEVQVAEGHLSSAIPLFPSEYMKQYNGNYNPEAQKLAEDAGFETWEMYYSANRSQWQHNPNIPSMSPYLFESNTSAPIVHLSRNHYLNMVDQEGNQLPYIDGSRIGPAVSGPDAIAMAVLANEVDWQYRGLDISHFPLLREGEEDGNYKVRLVPDTGGTYVDLRFNLTFHGPERELIGNKLFRIALSHAIDRDEINDVVFLGVGTPRNGLPSAEHPFYPGSEYERMYWTDIPRANDLLDSVMGPRDSEGFRTMPNGDRFHFEITTRDSGPRPKAAEMMCSDIQAVGVRCTILPLGGRMHSTRTRASEHMASSTGNCCAEAIFMFPSASIPTSRSSWAPEYGGWYRTGDGEEPPVWLKEIYTLVESANLAPKNAVEGAQEIFRQLIERAVQPGIMGGLGSRAVVAVGNDLAGVPDTWANRAGLQPHQNAFTERFYFSDPERRKERPKQLTHCPGCEPEQQEAGFGWSP
jgi:peptide/nickel transport system substrate-binding protein